MATKQFPYANCVSLKRFRNVEFWWQILWSLFLTHLVLWVSRKHFWKNFYSFWSEKYIDSHQTQYFYPCDSLKTNVLYINHYKLFYCKITFHILCCSFFPLLTTKSLIYTFLQKVNETPSLIILLYNMLRKCHI